jgi:hypothetical protein
MRTRLLFLPALLCAAVLLAAPAMAADQAYLPAAADEAALAWLSSARGALARLDDTKQNEVDRQVAHDTAVSALTALYQLSGCRWARAPLLATLKRPDTTGMHCGYSADGRVLLRLEPLELHNPVYAQYTIMLCTLESNTSQNLDGAPAGMLRLRYGDGTELSAEPLTPEHPLAASLAGLQGTFDPPVMLPSGVGISFKQVLAAARTSTKPVSAVRLQWGRYTIEVPYYENEVGVDRTRGS